jgi:UDP-3-O-[3-hydroxymyristoyl] N-acetylglucosamine deacetylase
MARGMLLYQAGDRQATVTRPVRFVGISAFHEGQASVTIHPAAPNSGLRFVCAGAIVDATIQNVYSSPHRTTSLHEPGSSSDAGSVRIHSVEHLLSALYGLGVTNARLAVHSNGLIPFFDGSAEAFCEKILQVGLRYQGQHARTSLYCDRRVVVAHPNGSSAWVDPPDDGDLTIHATIEFPPPIGTQGLQYVHSRDQYCLGIARARTFATKDVSPDIESHPDLPGFYRKHLFRGSYIDTPMLVFAEGKYITTPRFPDEAVRHRILDFIGDLALLGHDLRAKVTLHRPGHQLNQLLVSHLRQIALARHDDPSITPPLLQPKYDGDASAFVRDVTVPDGTTVARGEQFTKIWEITNCGSQLWKDRYLVREGPASGLYIIASPPRVPITLTRPGQSVVIAIPITAPSLPGSYVGIWKIRDIDDDYCFPNLHGLFLRILVE